MQTVKRTQNAAFRIVTECVRSTPVAHLHAESKVLPIRDHLDMRGMQIYAAASCPLSRTPPEHWRTGFTTLLKPGGSFTKSLPPTTGHCGPSLPIFQWGAQSSHWSTNTLWPTATTPLPLILLGEVPPAISTDETLLSKLPESTLPAWDVVTIRPFFYECRFREDTEPTCRWYENLLESLPHLLEDCPRLTAERAICGETHTGGPLGPSRADPVRSYIFWD